MPMFEITQESLVALKPTGFAAQGIRERADLQRLLRDQIQIIAPDVLIVSEEFGDWDDSRRRIDLLGIDRSANLVVIELKRTEDGGHMELQALRYAAMVSQMTFDGAVDALDGYLVAQGREGAAREILLQFLSWAEPDEDRFGQDVRIVLASAEFSRELTSAVLWLNERDLDIRCVRLRPYTDGARVFLDVQQIIPLPEASDYFVSLRAKREVERESRRREQQWEGLWFVNLGMDSPQIPAVDASGHGYSRHWSNCLRYGYLAAGGGRRYSDALRKLQPGDRVLAYQKGRGYLGYGIVTRVAEPMHEFLLDDGKSLEAHISPATPNGGTAADLWEYVVGIRWERHVELAQAKTFRGVFANQNIVCKLTHPETVRFVKREFEITDAEDPR